MATSLSSFFSFLLPPNHPQTPSPPPPPLPNLSLSQLNKNKTDKPFQSMVAVPQDTQNCYPTQSSSELASVICPSLAYANTLYFKSAYNVQVIVEDKENEPRENEERLLSRFRREVMKAGVIQECKRRRFFETKQDEKKRKVREAAKRNRRRRPQSRTQNQNKQESSRGKKDNLDEDNWDIPEGDIPF